MSINWGRENQSISSGLKKLADIYSQRIKPQYLKTIELNSNVVPLLNIIEKMAKTGTVGDSSYFHFEEDEIPQYVQLLAAQATVTDTALIMTASDTIKAIKANSILQVPRTGEQMAVVSVNYGTYTVNVTRGHGGSTPAALLINDYFQIFAMSDTDGNTAPSGVGVEPKKVTNYLQISKKAIELSGRMQNADTYQGGNSTREWDKMLYAFQQEQEKAYLFGLLSATAPITTGGLKYWISSNLVDQNSVALTETALESYLQKVYRFNQGRKLIFLCGEYMMGWINKFGKDRLYYNQESEIVPGIKVTKFRSVWGDMELIQHGMMSTNYDPGLTYNGYCFAICPQMIGKVSFRGREMQYLKGKQTPDLDGIKDYALADFGLWLGAERCHGLMINITNPLA